MAEWSETERTAMLTAIAAARDATFKPGSNPRVGCVLLTPDGDQITIGVHHGSGTPHAEVDALAAAGDDARGATAVVTLEPCNHTGRTGPCSEALLAAGIRRVVYAQPDPNPVAAGGAQMLRNAGLDVVQGAAAEAAKELNRRWVAAISSGRPHVTWKFAATLDGRSAAADQTSAWITSSQARADVHDLRAQMDAIIVGTGTVLADNPQLTVRDGTLRPVDEQPLRVVVGHRDIPNTAHVLSPDAPTTLIRHHDPAEVLIRLWSQGVRRVLLEGGPTVAGAFLAAGAIDEVVAYLAPKLLGSGPAALGDSGISTMSQIQHLNMRQVEPIGPDLKIVADIVHTPHINTTPPGDH